jgi:hypothetical protein
LKNANDWNYRDPDSGNSIAYLENRDNQEEILIGSVEKNYTKLKIDCCWFPINKSFSRGF